MFTLPRQKKSVEHLTLSFRDTEAILTLLRAGWVIVSHDPTGGKIFLRRTRLEDVTVLDAG